MVAAFLYSNMCDLLLVVFSQCQTVKCIFQNSTLKKNAQMIISVSSMFV